MNLRPSAPEADALPNCATPRRGMTCPGKRHFQCTVLSQKKKAGANKGIRTLDLQFTKLLLYRLSYIGASAENIIAKAFHFVQPFSKKLRFLPLAPNAQAPSRRVFLAPYHSPPHTTPLLRGLPRSICPLIMPFATNDFLSCRNRLLPFQKHSEKIPKLPLRQKCRPTPSPTHKKPPGFFFQRNPAANHLLLAYCAAASPSTISVTSTGTSAAAGTEGGRMASNTKFTANSKVATHRMGWISLDFLVKSLVNT